MAGPLTVAQNALTPPHSQAIRQALNFLHKRFDIGENIAVSRDLVSEHYAKK
jgi:hypothetical protein